MTSAKVNTTPSLPSTRQRSIKSKGQRISRCPILCLHFEFQFIEQNIDVTFFSTNKKVTKEVVRGEALRANSRNYGAIATGNRPILIRCAEYHSPRTLLPPQRPPPAENVPIFSGLYGADFQVCNMKAFKNRNIFECWMAMRRERYIGEGAFTRSASPMAASLGYLSCRNKKGTKYLAHK